MAFTSGMQELQRAIKEGKEKAAAREAGDGTFSPTLNWFTVKAGEKKIVRFITDDIVTEDFYNNIICNDGKTRTFLLPEGDDAALHRFMSDGPGIGWKKEYDGQIVEPYANRQAVGVAVKREEVLKDGRMVVQDDITEKEFNGTKYQTLSFGVFLQAIGNFWEPLVESVVARYGGACTRDLEIIRTGTSKNTTYNFPPLNEIPELATVEAVQAKYFYGYQWDVNDPDRFKKCPQTLQQWCAYHSSPEYYAKWLGPKDGSAPQGGADTTGLREFAAATTSNPADEAQASPGPFATLRNNLIDNPQQ